MRRVEVHKNQNRDEIDYIGTFVQYSLDSEYEENGPCHYPVAIIEKDDGTVEAPWVRLIRFTGELA